MNYKQSKTPYLSLVVVMALISGITHLKPQSKTIEISITSANKEVQLSAETAPVKNIVLNDIHLQNQKPYETTHTHPIVFVVD